ncbi:MAG: hypothetical protein ACK52U_16610 [Synechococcaceae cyanobacterium]
MDEEVARSLVSISAASSGRLIAEDIPATPISPSGHGTLEQEELKRRLVPGGRADRPFIARIPFVHGVVEATTCRLGLIRTIVQHLLLQPRKFLCRSR